MNVELFTGREWLCLIGNRDVAPRNILLTSGLEPVVCDFGLSRSFNPTSGLHQTTSTIGPFRIMAPENFSDRIYSTKSDVWSFGLCLVEIYSRKRVWEEQTPFEVMSAVVLRRETVPVPVECPTGVSKLLKSCWFYEANYRPSMKEIIEFLNREFTAVNLGS